MSNYIAVVQAFRKCAACDEDQAGPYERMICGCVWDVEIGDYPTQSAARMAAMAKAKRKGTTLQGRMTGRWSVESKELGLLEASK